MANVNKNVVIKSNNNNKMLFSLSFSLFRVEWVSDWAPENIKMESNLIWKWANVKIAANQIQVRQQ